MAELGTRTSKLRLAGQESFGIIIIIFLKLDLRSRKDTRRTSERSCVRLARSADSWLQGGGLALWDTQAIPHKAQGPRQRLRSQALVWGQGHLFGVGGWRVMVVALPMVWVIAAKVKKLEISRFLPILLKCYGGSRGRAD